MKHGLADGAKTLVIALGGNSIIPAGTEGTIEEQVELSQAMR